MTQKIIVRKNEFDNIEFVSNDVIVGRTSADFFNKGKFQGSACGSVINNSTLPEVLDHLMKVIHGNLFSHWGLSADFVTEY